MKPFIRKLLLNLAFFAAGIVMVDIFGTLMLGENAYTSAYTSNARQLEADTVTSAQTTALTQAETAVETEIADSETNARVVSMKKAAISEYEMAEVTAEGEEEEEEESTIGVADAFTVEYPEDKTTYYDSPQQAALNLTDTRDISNEYYTVYDEISGSVVTLNGHEIVCRMVNSEIGDSWGKEAIKAQAVAAYTYLRFNDARGSRPSVGLKSGYSKKLENIVKSVEGQAVYYKGSIINAVYSASTAGCSTTAKDVWGVDYPYLRAVKNDYDSSDPHWGKTKKLSAEKVKSIIESKTDITLSDDVTNWFKITSVYSGRYINTVSIDGHATCNYGGSTVTIKGTTLCNLFSIKSRAMEISYEDGVFTFTYYGWGHGVGMSQWGACLYARHGWTYDQILRHYYLGTTVKVSSTYEKAVKRGESADTLAETDDSSVDSSADTTTTTTTATTTVTTTTTADTKTSTVTSGQTSTSADKSTTTTTTKTTQATTTATSGEAQTETTTVTTVIEAQPPEKTEQTEQTQATQTETSQTESQTESEVSESEEPAAVLEDSEV
jgi:stage II sporulation protein D